MITEHLYISALLCLGLFSAGETHLLISVDYVSIVCSLCLTVLTKYDMLQYKLCSLTVFDLLTLAVICSFWCIL